VNGKFASDLLPGYLMVGVGIAFAFVPVSIAALARRRRARGGARVRPHQHLPADRRSDRHRRRVDGVREPLQGAREGRPLGPDALTHGYGYAFWALAFFGVAAIVLR
jgi:hypothetical protein